MRVFFIPRLRGVLSLAAGATDHTATSLSTNSLALLVLRHTLAFQSNTIPTLNSGGFLGNSGLPFGLVTKVKGWWRFMKS